MAEIVVVFTSFGLPEFRASGGSGWWKLGSSRARQAGKVLVAHNAHDPKVPGDESLHGVPVLLATIRDIIRFEDGRHLLQFGSYAEVIGSRYRWPGHQNPVAYMEADALLDQIEVGGWQTMPTVSLEAAAEVRRAWYKKHAG